jgi:hypothetical protein
MSARRADWKGTHTFNAEREFGMSAARSQGGRSTWSPTGDTFWELIGAILGRGTVLVGRSPRDPEAEALLLAPPGVRIPEPEDAEEPVSTQDWRVALWAADDEGNLHVDVGRPRWVSVVSLAYVIALIELECPEFLGWVADHLERRLLNACIASMPDAGGNVLPAGDRWRRDVEAMLDELDIATSGDPVPERRSFNPPVELPPAIATGEPGHPEKHEPRLAPGWLRRFYGARCEEVVAAQNRGVQS